MGKKSHKKKKNNKKRVEKQRKDKKTKHQQKPVLASSKKEEPSNGFTWIDGEDIAMMMRDQLLRPDGMLHLDLTIQGIFAEYSQQLKKMQNSSNEEIIKILQKYGVDYSQDDFLKEVKRFPSSYSLLIHWEKKYPVGDIPGLDQTVICEAVNILAKRLIPNFINNDGINDMMQDGYTLLEKGKFTEACEIWLCVWEHLKKRFTPEMKSIEDAEKVFPGTQSLFNWCQDLNIELENAATDDSSFYEKNIKYCQEFYIRFPKTSWLTIHNMKCSEAESYFALGMLEKGEAAFQTLVKDFPDYAWGYVRWADMYCSSLPAKNIPVDYDKSEKLYKKALAIAREDEDDVIIRLKDLEEKRKKNTK